MPDQDLCSDVIKWGIWSTNLEYSKTEFAEQTINFFKQNTTYSKTDTINAAQKAKILLPADSLLIPMNIDGSFGLSKAKNFSDALVEYFEKNISFRKEYLNHNINADTNIVNAWIKCQEFRKQTKPLLIAEPRYEKVVSADLKDRITIILRASIIPEHHGKIMIDIEKLKRSLKLNGCELVSNSIDPLIDGENTFTILRRSEFRSKEGTLQIRTNMMSYRTDCILKEHLNANEPRIAREIGTEREKIFVAEQVGSNEFLLPFGNDKDKDVFLRAEAQFSIYGKNEKVDLFLYGSREEQLQELGKSPILQWNDWLNVKVSYNVDIPFFKNSPLLFKAAFYSWTGERIDLDTASIKITLKY